MHIVTVDNKIVCNSNYVINSHKLDHVRQPLCHCLASLPCKHILAIMEYFVVVFLLTNCFFDNLKCLKLENL